MHFHDKALFETLQTEGNLQNLAPAWLTHRHVAIRVFCLAHSMVKHKE
jgi:hypothetical protein